MATLYRLLIVVSLALASSVGVAFADEMLATAADEPAIMASLGEQGVQALDDGASAKVRGEAATMYVMFTLWKPSGGTFLNFVGSGNTASRSGTIADWRYGYWGGLNWSRGEYSTVNCMCTMSGSSVDTMDTLFQTHDNAYALAAANLPALKTTKEAADIALLDSLKALPSGNTMWDGRQWYVSNSTDPTAPTAVNMSFKTPVMSGSTVAYYTTTYKEMTFSEYARRQALSAITALKVARSLH